MGKIRIVKSVATPFTQASVGVSVIKESRSSEVADGSIKGLEIEAANAKKCPISTDRAATPDFDSMLFVKRNAVGLVKAAQHGARNLNQFP